MAKAKNEVANEVKIDSNNPPKIEDVKFKPAKDSDILMVKTVRGKDRMWTLAECLLPQNWKQIVPSMQNIILNGTSVAGEITKQ